MASASFSAAMSRCSSLPVASVVAQTPTDVLRDGVESPQELAVVGVVGFHEAADAIFAAVGADQNLALDGRGGHRLAVSLFRIADLLLPDDRTGLGVERDELGVERRDIDLVVEDRDAAIVRAATESGHRAELRLEVPDFLAGLGVEGIDVAVRGGDVHHAVDHDRRRLERLLDLGLEDPGRMHPPDVAAVDLPVRVEAGLLVVSVGLKEIRSVVCGAVEFCLRDRLHHGRPGHGAPGSALDFLLSRSRPGAKEGCDADRSKQECTIGNIGHRLFLPDGFMLHANFRFVTSLGRRMDEKIGRTEGARGE